MKDTKRMDIEGIERHERNFRLFMAFLKFNKIYFIKKLIFDERKRKPCDLFITMNLDRPNRYDYFNKSYAFENNIDRAWAIIFQYLPYFGSYWDCDFFKCRSMYVPRISIISNEWMKYLMEYNLKEN